MAASRTTLLWADLLTAACGGFRRGRAAGWRHGSRRKEPRVQRARPGAVAAPADTRARRGARRRQRHAARDAAAHPGRRRSRHRPRAVDQLTRRVGAVHARHPRCHAAGAVRRLDPGARAGLQRRAVPAVGRRQGQAVRAAACPHPDAPGLGRHRRQRGRHRSPGRRPSAHGGHRARPHRRGHRPAGRAHLRRLPARPLVHGRAGHGLRLHRRDRRLVRRGHASQETPDRFEGDDS